MSEISNKYKPETSADELLVILRRLNICGEAKDFYEQYAGKTIKDMVDETPDQSWATWYLVVLGRENDVKLRKAMIAHIKDPMMAFSLYLRLAWLTDEEDKLLEVKFRGKLPTAEAELANGIVKREKVEDL